MSDLFSSLRDQEQLPTPPASEVRRRGDSLRRRRHALQGVGVAAAVAAVALAAVGVTGGFSTSSEPPVATRPTTPETPSATPSETPSQTPSSTAVTTIPASIDVARGLVDSGTDDELTVGPQVRWIADEVACDADHSPADEELDRVGALLTMPQHSSGRDLRVYADAATARRVAREFASWFQDCPSFSIDGGASETVNTVYRGEPLRNRWTILQTYRMGGRPQLGQNILLVEHIGNAVLVVKDYGEGPGATDEDQMMNQVATLDADIQPLRTQLECVFGDGTEGC